MDASILGGLMIVLGFPLHAISLDLFFGVDADTLVCYETQKAS